LEFRPSNRARIKADKYERDALQEAERVSDRGAQRQQRMQREQARILKEKQTIFDRERGFNFIKFPLPLHYSDHIRRYGHVQGFSTDAGRLHTFK
jgi:hypothetical protein